MPLSRIGSSVIPFFLWGLIVVGAPVHFITRLSPPPAWICVCRCSSRIDSCPPPRSLFTRDKRKEESLSRGEREIAKTPLVHFMVESVEKFCREILLVSRNVCIPIEAFPQIRKDNSAGNLISSNQREDGVPIFSIGKRRNIKLAEKKKVTTFICVCANERRIFYEKRKLHRTIYLRNFKVLSLPWQRAKFRERFDILVRQIPTLSLV